MAVEINAGMLARAQGRMLLVEGETDLNAIAEIIAGNGVSWREPPVYILPMGTGTPKSRDIATYLVTSGLKTLGIVLDADSDANVTWQRIKGWIRHQVAEPGLQELIEASGFDSAIRNARGIRIGAWIMPDCRSNGTWETLLKQMVRPETQELLEHGIESTRLAKTDHAAPFKEVHREKAELFTWLAWQDEPGRNFKNRDFNSIFDPQAEAARPFVDWFRRLFDV